MEGLLSRASLTRQVEALAALRHLQDPFRLIADSIDLLQPPERISTVDCAERFRDLPGPEEGTVVRYDRWRTPYNVGPMNSLDNPKCNLLVMVKPSRSGGTTVAENYLFKMAMFGPMGHVTWILNSDEAVTAYCRNVVKPMFELNSKLQAKVGGERGDDTDSYKKVRGYPVEWLSAKDSTFRNREPIFMVSDETDAWAKKYARTPKVQIEGRQKQLGSRRKGAIMSHPDLGWTSGVAAGYEDSSRGIFIMKCPDCLGFATAHATKFWPEVPQFKLDWDCNEYEPDPAMPGHRRLAIKREQVANDRRLDLAQETAVMLCPHCGVGLTDAQRREMVDAAVREAANSTAGWMHRGQALDEVEGIIGEMIDHPTHGYWVHGLMLKTETLAQLAREYEAALIDFERTRDPQKLKEFMSKRLGEVFEGAATTGGLSANALKARVRDSGYLRGTVPPGVKFITAAIDTGGRKFDVAWLGWDVEGRSWLIDRLTIRQREHDDGEIRDLHVAGSIEDWMVLLPRVVDRTFPMQGHADLVMPVACTCIDSGDGNVTWKAREFARRAQLAGYVWGQSWSKIKLVKGLPGKRPMLPDAPRKVSRDENGKNVDPVIYEYNLGSWALKDLVYERLAVADDGPGQCRFPMELDGRFIDEFFGETLIDGKWIRSGPNEMLDLYGYAEAGRQMLKPERKDIKWDQGKLPPWARPVRLQPEGGDQDAPASEDKPKAAKPASRFNRFDALTRKP